ncbi:MAG: DUF6531 domain-containing protein, partial [Actinomycetota bacterium]|nr:DUF6531 domain-containing protein [Actinomycetota bacterium]
MTRPNRAPAAPTLVSPAADGKFGSADPQVFVVNAVDPDGDPYTGTVNITNTNTGIVTTVTTAPAVSGSDSDGTPIVPLGQGTYKWKARATDAAGVPGEWSQERTFTIGNQAPIVPTLISPAPGATLSNDDGLQLFTIAASDAEGNPYTGTVTVRNVATSAVTTFSTSVALSGHHSQGAPAPALTPGDYVWKARATDALGQPGPESAERALRVIVNQAPGIPTLIAPTPGKVLYQGDPQVFTIAADDPNGDMWHGIVRVKDNFGLIVDTIRTLPAQSGGYASGVPTLPLGPGDYTWDAAATDNPDPSAPPPTTWSVTRAFSVSSASDIPPTALPSDRATTRASRNALGEQAMNGMNEDPVVSGDGRWVAFESEADNLVPLDTNGEKDVFVHDRLTGITERVSVSDSEAQSAGGWVDSFDPSISEDGRYVAFISGATNLVPGDTNGAEDVFVRDREAGTTTRVNVANGLSGGEANASALEADLSEDGRHVAFSTYATNLGTSDTNGVADIYVRDIDGGVTERVSTPFMTPSGEVVGGTFGSRDPSISSGGRYVAFESDVETFEGGGNPDNNFTWDVFFHDRNASWGSVRVSTKAPFWEDTGGTSRNPEISSFGDYVVFESTSTDMVSGDNDTNGTWDVFRYRESDSSMRRVSFNSSGAQLNGPSFDAGVSGGGFIVFRSSATNAVANDRNGVDDVFLRDVEHGTTTLLSHDADGHQANNTSMNPSVSADGMHVAFTSFATNLISADTNRGMDVFVYNRRLSLTCAAGALSAVGCLSGYGFKASSDRLGLEDFYSYHAFDAGSDTALLNVSNGNLVVQGTDLNVPGQGLNMKLTHTYNSLKDQGGGPLGRGWRIGVADGESADLLGAVVSAVLSADVGQLLEVVVTQDQFDFFDADGTRHHFIKGGLDGPGWHAPPGVNLTLTDEIVGGEQRYKATRPDGVSYEFRPLVGGGGYFVTRIADRNGNQLTFSYTSGKISSITDTNGRSITFTWSGDYLSSATYGGVTVSYSISGDRLQSISVGGRTTNYGYDVEGLRTITDARGHTTTFTLASGMLTNVRDREGKDWPISYNEGSPDCQPGDPGAAVATCIRDPEGNAQVYTSSAEGNLLVHRDEGDTTVNQRSYLWEGNRIVSETGYGGHTNEYAYNENGQVVLKREFGAGDQPLTTALVYRDVAPGVADLVEANVGVDSSDLRTWRFTRSEKGNLTATTDPEGSITTFTYDTTGRLTSVTDPRSKTTSYGSFHASGQPQTITDPLGKSRTYTYDDFGRTTSVVDRNGHTWSTAYDARGNVTSKSSPNGTATFGYDANDNQTSATPPGGATVTRTYDKRDLPRTASSTVDGVTRQTTYDYYLDGALHKVHGPRESAGSPTVSQTTEYVRYANNRVQTLVDESGFRTDFTYTGEGLVRTVLEPPGTVGRHATSYTYNRRGQVTSETETNYPEPTTSTNVYGPHGELLSSRTPMGHTTTFAYDKMGRLIRTIDPQGRQSTRTYDRAGNLVTLTQPEGQGGQLTTTYSYSALNQILSETDGADGSHVVEYQYDDEGRQTFRYDKRNGTVERTVAQTHRADGAVLTRTASAPGLPTHQSSFGYDAAGNMTSASATVGGSTVSSLSLTYNGAFEPSTWSETVYDTAGNARTQSGAYSYQPDGLLSARSIAGELTTYGYTANGRESQVDPWGAPGTFDSQYYDNGLLRMSTMPNGVVTDQLFDTGDRLKSRIVRRNDLLMTPVSTWTGIEYDNDDRRIEESVTQEQVPDTTAVSLEFGTGHYAYDSLGRLTSTTHPFDGRPTDYTLDDGGNVVHDGDTAFTFTKNRLDRSAGTTTKNEVGGGSTTTTATAVFQYDALGNQEREASTATSTSVIDEEVTETGTRDTVSVYSYDGASHPVRVHNTVNDTIAGNTQNSVDYAYDPLGRLVRRVEHPASGPDVVTLFFHDGTSDQLALETDGAGNVQVRYVLDSEGSPVAQDKAGARSYYVDDPRGNLTQQLDHSQAVVAVYAYDPYGKEKSEHTKSKAPSWESRLRFQ